MSNLEQIAKAKGFNSLEELNRLVANIDLQRPGAFSVFVLWKRQDGTKDGLLLAFPEAAYAESGSS